MGYNAAFHYFGVRATSHRLRHRQARRWRGYSVTSPASGRESSASSRRTTWGTVAIGRPGKGNDKGKVEGPRRLRAPEGLRAGPSASPVGTR